MKAKQLNVGFVGNGDIFDEVVTEVLNHQGILFKEVSGETKKYEKLPCVVLPRYVDSSYEVARKHCEDEDNIIIAEKQMPLSTVLSALGGEFGDSSTDLMHPMINQYETQLLIKIKEKYFALDLPFVRKWFWPDFFEACCVLTHDVDWLYYSPWHFAVTRNKSILQLTKLAYQGLIHKRNYGNNIPEIVSKEKQRNIKSTFFFLAKYYGAHQQEFLKILEVLRKEKIETGLHGSFRSYRDSNLLKMEKDRLERYVNAEVKGVRQHELNFLIPLTWEYQEKAGFAYDLTFSYSTRLGFRSGLCFPYHPIDIATSKFSLLEIPTSFMDWTVLSKPYDDLLKILEKLEQVVEEYNGCLAMNFHNTYQNKETFPNMEKFYTHVLDDLKERNYWFTTAHECYAWWMKKENTRVDVTIKDDVIKGKTSHYPIPVIVEDANNKRKYVNLQSGDFRISTVD